MQSGNIKVFARVRPLNEKELQADSNTCIASFDAQRYCGMKFSIKLKEAGNITSANQTAFTFDRVFGSGSSQKQVFDAVAKDLLDGVFEGINGTVFAYGQTSSGKTFTCMGPDINNPEQKGLIPRLVDEIFQRIQQAPGSIQFRLKLSFVQIYMQKLRDLIDVSRASLKIRQSKTRGIYIENCSEMYVGSVEEVIKFIQVATSNRSLGHTNMNEASSRSHMVLFLTVYQNNLQDLSAKSAKLTIIDLAGSEKVGKTGAEGKILEQAKQINKSLSALGNVINALTEAKIGHVPYRDSKLTRILQESLGGNAKTSLIINLSPSILNDFQTLSTLRFGYRAKNIKNSPKVNRQYTVAQLLLLLEKAELKIKELERVLKGGAQPKAKKQEAEIAVGSDQQQDEKELPKQAFEPPSEQMLLPQQQLSVPSQQFTISSVQPSPVRAKVNQIAIETTPIDFPNQDVCDRISLLTQQVEQLTNRNTELSRNYSLQVEKHNALKLDHGFLQARIVALEQDNQRFVEESLKIERRCAGLEEKLRDEQERLEFYIVRDEQMQKEVDRMTKLGEMGIPIRKFAMPKPQDKKAEFFGEVKQQSDLPEDAEDIFERIKRLEKQNELYKHLQEQKNKFLAERNQFEQQKNKLYRDLENRVQKVVVLEQMLDEERDRNQCLLRNINSDQKSKTKRIVNLEAYVTELSTSYYVLKNQQSSWQADHNIFENKLRRKSDRIVELERELSTTKENLYMLKTKYEQLAQATRSRQGIEVYCRDSEKRQPNIVKVLRSTLTPRVNESIN